MTTVIVTSGDRNVAYRILEGEIGDRMVIEPVRDRSLDEILAEEGHRLMTAEEFEEHFGHLPVTPND